MCVSHLISKRFNKKDTKIGYKIVITKNGNLESLYPISINNNYAYCNNTWNVEKSKNTTPCICSGKRYDVGFHMFTNKKDALTYYLDMQQNYPLLSLELYKVEYKNTCTYGKEMWEQYNKPKYLNIVVAKKFRFLEKLLPIDKQTKI